MLCLLGNLFFSFKNWVRNYRVRSDRFRNYWVRSDRVRNDQGKNDHELEMIGYHYKHNQCCFLKV